jgi:hypothetical protein
MGDAHGDRVAAEQALVQQFDVGALDKAQFDQAAFQLGARQAGTSRINDKFVDSTTKTHAGVAQCYGWFGIHCE